MFRVQGVGCRVEGSGFRVQVSGFRVQGLGSQIISGEVVHGRLPDFWFRLFMALNPRPQT